jgi:hypothetical protein
MTDPFLTPGLKTAHSYAASYPSIVNYGDTSSGRGRRVDATSLLRQRRRQRCHAVISESRQEQ